MATLLPFHGFSFDKKPVDHVYSIMHDGLKRTYLLHSPDNLEKGKSVPLLIALHGKLGTGKLMVKLTCKKFNTLADKEGFIVVYPDGIDKSWNDGRPIKSKPNKINDSIIDDVGFISALIDELIKTHCVDPARVYVTGMSNGAMMTQRLAIELSDKIAAAAPVCGNIPVDLKSTPKNSVAMLIINGTADPLVPYEGGEVHFLNMKVGKVTSTVESVNFWVSNNKINNSPKFDYLPDTNPADGCRVKRTSYGNIGEKGEVVLITIEGGGHTWAGGMQYAHKMWIGKTCRDINACDMIWEFCKQHSK